MNSPNGTNRIEQATPVRMSTNVSVNRQSDDMNPGERFRNSLNTAANGVAGGISAAAPFIPGAGIVSAAVSSVGTVSNSSSSGPVNSGGRGYGSMAYASGGGGFSPAGVTSFGGARGTTLVGASGGGFASAPSGITSVGGSIIGSDPSLGTGLGGSGLGGDVVSQMHNENMGLLSLQNAMQQENQQVTMMSNVLKTRHDTVKNTVSNVR